MAKGKTATLCGACVGVNKQPGASAPGHKNGANIAKDAPDFREALAPPTMDREPFFPCARYDQDSVVHMGEKKMC